jgi:hypothetical protein
VGDPPIALLPVSATEGIGMDALLVQLGKLMNKEDEARVAGIKGGDKKVQAGGRAGGRGGRGGAGSRGGGGGWGGGRGAGAAGRGGGDDKPYDRRSRKTKETTGEGTNMTVRF